MRPSSLLLLAVALTGCSSSAVSQDDTDLPGPVDPFPGVTAALTVNPASPPNYANLSLPAHYAGLVGSPTDNGRNAPVTNAGALLGRVLFYDRQLSINNTLSCATCHAQATAFSDPAQFSTGFDDARQTTSHSMRLANARFFGPGTAFWDRRAATLEAQATEPIINPVEMGFDAAAGGLDSLIRRMNRLPYYPELFEVAFGDTVITAARMRTAIAQYVRSIVSAGSRWDDGYAAVFNPGLPDRGVNIPIPSFSAQENRGRQLFFTPPPQGGAGCAACHVAPTFALAGNSLSNGLDAGETRVFKSPSLKNVAGGGPFMHDGRFDTLEEVIDHYDSGVQNGPALDQRLRGQGGMPLRLNLTAADKAALVAFMQTLTDTRLAADVRYSDPFRR